MEVTMDEVKNAKDRCNTLLENIDLDIGILDYSEELEGNIEQIPGAWQTSGGEEKMKKIMKILADLNKEMGKMQTAMHEIKGKRYNVEYPYVPVKEQK